jgi:drug/metabolite transporter (DMT)-like permease
VGLRREFVKPHGASGLRISARSTNRSDGSGRLATPPFAYFYLGVMVATWAANWPLMRLALAHTEPMVFASLRMVGSIAILAPILAVLRRPMLPIPTERLALFWIGLFQVTGFLVFSIIGLAIVAPGRAIVLAFTMPLWSVRWTPGFLAILAYNWVFTTALGYYLWNKVLAVMSPAVAGQVLTLTPISGFLLSTLIFGGAITLDIVAGILLIATGLVLTLRP